MVMRRSRSAVNDSLYNTRLNFTVDSALLGNAPPIKYSQIDIPAALSFTMGKNLNTCATYKLVGYCIRFAAEAIEDALLRPGTGLNVSGALHYVVPTDARVRALKHTYEEWLHEAQEEGGRVRHRAFRPAYSRFYPATAWQSYVNRSHAAHAVYLLDQGVNTAQTLSIFQEFNERNPVYPEPTQATGTGIPYLIERTDRLYTDYASEIEEVLPWNVGKSFQPGQHVWNTQTNAVQLTYVGGAPMYEYSTFQWAPAGCYWPVMCGQMEIVLEDLVGFTNEDQAFQFGCDLWIAGWKDYY